MQSRSGRSQQIRHNYTKIYVLTAALCLVVTLIVSITITSLGVVQGKGSVTTDPPAPSTPVDSSPSIPSTPDTTPSQPSESKGEEPVGKIQYIAVTENDLKAANPLLIVNAQSPFNPARAKDIVNMYELADKSNSKNRLQFMGSYSPLNKEAFEALQQLQFTVGAANEGFCFMITQGHISVLNADGKVNCNCSESELTDVSHSTHSTGYVVDLRYYKDGAGYQVFDATMKNTVTKTLLENCGKFGWIQSWSAANLTANGKISTDQRNFRYVGVPHALYIMEKGLTFDGYMEALKSTNYNKPLQITNDSTVYNVYYVSSEFAFSKGVPVPQGSSYTIQGNGVDGFIVTLTVNP